MTREGAAEAAVNKSYPPFTSATLIHKMSLSITARKRARLAYASASSSTNYNDNQTDPDVFGRRRKTQARLRTLAFSNTTETSDPTMSTTTITTLPEEEYDATLPEQNEEYDVIESDTLSTIRYILGISLVKDNSVASRLPRMCMVNQLYSVLFDNTNVDRELNTLVEQGVIRKFRIGGTLDEEFAVMLMDDCVMQIREAKAEFEEDLRTGKGTQKGNETADLFDRFEHFTSSGSHTEVSVTRHRLTEGMSASEEEISQLIMYGLLTTRESDVYWFSIRRAGNFVHHLFGGRKEILRMLKRNKFGELLEKQLQAKKIRNSIFRYEFHLHDLIGSGRVESVKTTMGKLIKLTKKGEGRK